jgi:hypothetical protein
MSTIWDTSIRRVARDFDDAAPPYLGEVRIVDLWLQGSAARR